MTTSRRLRVFLCHSSIDKDFVRQLCLRLKSDGIEPWLDEESLVAGQDWEKKIDKELPSCDVVLVCLSRQSIAKGNYFHREIELALAEADKYADDTIFIIPVRLEECDIPERLQKRLFADLFKDQGYQKLLSALQVRGTQIRSRANHSIAEANERLGQAFIKELVGMSQVQSSFEKDQMTRSDLKRCLGLCSHYGFRIKESELLSGLPRSGADHYGRVSLDITVKFIESETISTSTFLAVGEITRKLRTLVLSNFLEEGGLHLRDLGWAYWTEAVWELWKKEGWPSFTRRGSITFVPAQAPPSVKMESPKSLTLTREGLQLLSTLYMIEQKMILGIQEFYILTKATKEISERQFQAAKEKIHQAIDDADKFSQAKLMEPLFFLAIARVQPEFGIKAICTLKIVCEVSGARSTKTFIAGH